MPDKPASYQTPYPLGPNQWGFAGRWTIGEEKSVGAAAGFLFGSLDALFHGALLGANFGARFRYDFALFGDSHFHARLHDVERQKCRSSGDEHRQENPQ